MSGISRATKRKRKSEETKAILLRDLKRCELAANDQSLSPEQRSFWSVHLDYIQRSLSQYCGADTFYAKGRG